MNYTDYKKAKADFQVLVDKQIEILEQSHKQDTETLSQLKACSKHLKDDTLKVLVMGVFSAGKSTFLNALMGDKLLPEGLLPVTAIIGEITYQQEWEILLEYREGNLPPESIERAALKQYVTIDNMAEEHRKSPYSRVLIKAPFQICEQGVNLIDSPGLNDPDAYEEVTMQYLPQADAIIYLMPCEGANSKSDQDTIKYLHDLGYKSLVFVITKMDHCAEDELEDFKEVQRLKLIPQTELKADGLFFVNSLGARNAKMKGDEQALAQTGFPELEQGLEKVLVEQRGKLKLGKVLHRLGDINKELTLFFEDRLKLSAQDFQVLKNKLDKANEALVRAKEKGDIILAKVALKLDDLLADTDAISKEFLDDSIKNMDRWVDSLKTTKELSYNPTKLKSSVEAYAAECMALMKVRFEIEVARWSNKKLIPFMDQKFQDIAKEIDLDMNAYQRELIDIRVNLGLLDDKDIAKGDLPSGLSKFALVTASVLFLNPSFAYGALFGGKALIASIVTTLVLSLVGLLIYGPFGVVSAILLGAFGSFLGVGFGHEFTKSKIHKEIAKQMKEAFSGKLLENKETNTQVNLREEFIAQVKHSFGDEFERLKTAFRHNLDKDIEDYQKLVNSAEQLCKESDLPRMIHELETGKANNALLMKTLCELGKRWNL